MPSVLGHSAACCNIPPVISKGYSEKGKFETINGLKTCDPNPRPSCLSHAYEIIDVVGSPTAKKAIFWVYDIFGYFPQTLQGADILATSPEEYQVFIPDFFEGSPADISWYPPETEEQKKALYGWFESRTPPTGAEKIPAIVKGIEEKYGKKTWGAVGFCWGGKVCSITSGEGTPFKAVAQTSPASKSFSPLNLVTGLCCLDPSQQNYAFVFSATC